VSVCVPPRLVVSHIITTKTTKTTKKQKYSISDEGGIAIFEALYHNIACPIHTLILDRNELGDATGKCVVVELRRRQDVCVTVCVCVCVRERERESVCVCFFFVCVCVCV